MKIFIFCMGLSIGGNMLGNNTTQQHVLAALQAQQTQNLLVALQAQQMSGLTQSSLLPTPGMSMQRGGKVRSPLDYMYHFKNCD